MFGKQGAARVQLQDSRVSLCGEQCWLHSSFFIQSLRTQGSAGVEFPLRAAGCLPRHARELLSAGWEFPMGWFLIGKRQYTEIKAPRGNVPASGNLSWETFPQAQAGAFPLGSVSKGSPHPTSPSLGTAGGPQGWGHPHPLWTFCPPRPHPQGPLTVRFLAPQMDLTPYKSCTPRDTDPSP